MEGERTAETARSHRRGRLGDQLRALAMEPLEASRARRLRAMAPTGALLLLLWIVSGPALSVSASSQHIRHQDLQQAPSAGVKQIRPDLIQQRTASSSVLAALMESPYTDLMELMERAGMLEPLEKVVGKSSITILAPRNAFLDKQVDSEFKHFLLQPGNVKHLRTVIKHHILAEKIPSQHWKNTTLRTLAGDPIRLHSHGGILKIDLSDVVVPNAILRSDGVVHAVDGFLVPRSVQNAFSTRKQDRRSLAVLPEAAPEFDPSATSLASMNKELMDFLEAAESPLPLEFAPAPDFAPAPAPGPSSAKHRVYSWEDVDDFVATLANFGGYSEMAELLVNLTSFAWDMAKLVNEGHRLTLLAPNDHAIDHLTTEQLNAPGGIEAMLMYHVLTEYQTEESLYNAVRRFEKVSFPTLKAPHSIKAKEADGTVQFGEGELAALLYDHDIFTDGHLSVQGINKVLLPPGDVAPKQSSATETKTTNKRGRGLTESTEQQGGLSLATSIRNLLHF